MSRPITILDTGSPDHSNPATMSGTNETPASQALAGAGTRASKGCDMSLPGSRGDCKVRAATVRARLPVNSRGDRDVSAPVINGLPSARCARRSA